MKGGPMWTVLCCVASRPSSWLCAWAHQLLARLEAAGVEPPPWLWDVLTFC